MKILCIIPARSGSKEVPGKNLKILSGKPLIHWPILAAKKVSRINRLIISTDSREIADCSSQAGATIPFLRPKTLATSKTHILDVIKHAVKKEAEAGHHFTHILVLQATSPTVLASDINSSINLLNKGQFDTIITYYRYQGPNPALMLIKGEKGLLKKIMDKSQFETQRQNFNDVFVRTGLLYLFSVNNLENNSIYGEKLSGIEVKADRAITIDSFEDFNAAEAYFKTTFKSRE